MNAEAPAPAPLTPAMADLVERMRRARRMPFHRMPIAEARRLYSGASELLELPRAKDVTADDLSVPATGGAVLPARLYRPAAGGAAPLPVLLFLHGGGFVIGDLESHDSLCRQLCRRSGGAVLSLAYRLAPEHRFPTAVEDAWAAMAWLAGGALAGADARRIAVGGDSAGGTLAAVCALRARDLDLEIALQLLITPGTSGSPDTASRRTYGSGYVLEAESIEGFFAQYIDASDRADWRFAPLRAPDLSRVAPACVILAECDPLFDEGLEYVERLRAAGVDVQLEICRGLTHDFIKMGRMIGEASLAQATAGDALALAWRLPRASISEAPMTAAAWSGGAGTATA